MTKNEQSEILHFKDNEQDKGNKNNIINNNSYMNQLIDFNKIQIFDNKKIEIKEEEIDNDKEFFRNSPKSYLFIKVIFLFPANILRVFVQLGDFYFSIILTNIYLEIIIIYVNGCAESNVALKIIALISALIFCFLGKSFITIPYWEVHKLKWFDLNPFNSITNLLNIKLKKDIIRNIYYIVNIILGILFLLFLLGFILFLLINGTFFDVLTLIILIIIPGLKFILIYLSFIFIGIINIIFNNNKYKDETNPFFYWWKLKNLIDQGVIEVGNPNNIKNTKDGGVNNSKNNNDINCCEKIFCRRVLFYIKFSEKCIRKICLRTILKIFVTFLSFIYIIYLFIKKGATVGSVFF